MRAIIPVNGGMSVSATISPSSMVVSQVIWSLCGNIGAVWHGVMPSVDVRVLLGISSACSMSSCFMISSASIAWPGESEPGVAEYKRRELQQNSQANITLLDKYLRVFFFCLFYQFLLLVRKSWRLGRRWSQAGWCVVGCLPPQQGSLFYHLVSWVYYCRSLCLRKKRQLFNKLKTKYLSKWAICFTTLLVCGTFIRSFPANSGDRFVGKASSLWCWRN